MDVASTTVQIQGIYDGLTEGQKAVFLPELVDANDRLAYTLSLNASPETPWRMRANFGVGKNKLADPEPENRERIAHVYLPHCAMPFVNLGPAMEQSSRRCSKYSLRTALEISRLLQTSCWMV